MPASRKNGAQACGAMRAKPDSSVLGGPAARAPTTTPPAARTTAFRALVQSPLKVWPAIAFGQCRHSDQPRIRTAASSAASRVQRPARMAPPHGQEQDAGDVGDQVLLRGSAGHGAARATT